MRFELNEMPDSGLHPGGILTAMPVVNIAISRVLEPQRVEACATDHEQSLRTLPCIGYQVPCSEVHTKQLCLTDLRTNLTSVLSGFQSVSKTISFELTYNFLRLAYGPAENDVMIFLR
jgi:hypothetical protein